ncbi:fluoride efflux transporter CrcB [Pontibacter sp. G13]|uniref:fluoride efflux transporter CrcB n=1 Tax=Pontibacter sp. G13 TaxID=3074898 RepID=UPI00288C1CEC|nr:fluoride efflux transporter CrcB [Pontibacter sp. G13]WNJ17601.1 fluoride efflux transporter CrcB [Pontibacter sp. G13]
MELFAIFLGGGAGSLCRYGLAKAFPAGPEGFPYGTLAANFLACVVLGVAWHYFASHTGVNSQVKAMVLVGFCGGFSTFSTFSFETLRLIQAGNYGIAALYVIGSMVSCLLVLMIIGKWMK